MKITDVRVHLVSPMGSTTLTKGARLGWVFIEIDTDDGITGLGECSNWPRQGDVLVGHTLEVLKEEILGRDPAHIEAIWNDLFRQYTYLGNRGLITTVISGINIALWDIKGKAAGKPIYDLLGGPVREDVLLYTHPAGATPEDLAAGGRRLVEEGYTALKVDPFREQGPKHTAFLGGEISSRGIREGAEAIAALRDAVGPDVEILIDAHGNFNVATALRCIRALEPFDLTWFEEPVPPEGVDALAQIRAQTTVDLCVGERLFTRWDILPILQRGLASYLMPDVCWTGGISELKKISTMAEAYFIPMSPHNALGPIQILAGAHTMMTVPNFYRLEIHRMFMEMYNACITPELDVVDGRLRLSDRPGLGAELDHDYVAAHPDPDWKPLS